jgi:hypothetical protein
MRASSLVKLTLVVGVVSVLVGCTSLFNPNRSVTPPLKADSVSEPLSTLGDSCSTAILEPDRSALLQEALTDSHLHAVKAQLESRGLGMNSDEAQAVQLVGGEQVLIPFGERAHLVWTRTSGQTAAVGLVRQGNKTINISANGEERVVRFLNPQKAEKLLGKLRQKSKFQQFEAKLSQKGKRLGQIRVLFDETKKVAIIGLANEGHAEKVAHQVRIKLKGDRDDEPQESAEPVIQATACGQATGEAVPTGAAMQPLAAPPGEGDFEGGYEGPQICTSQWGYDYLCTQTTPLLSLSTTSLSVPQTFITQQTQAAFTIWNGAGGKLTGTVTTSAPFSIVSGGSFSLSPGQPQEVTVKFSSATAGSFSKNLSISSTGGNKTVTATSVAHKVSFSPATVDFGSGLLVLREQCNEMGVCGPHTEQVGLPIEKSLTVKNEGSVAVTLTLSTAAPYKVVSVLPTLSPGQSGQVTVRFDPSEPGSFTGNVQVGINGGQGSVTSSPLVGVAHKIEVSPAELSFGLVFVDSTREQKLTVKNQGVTSVSLAVSTNEPYSVVSTSSFTLASSQSQDVTVRFTPISSNVFSGTIRLSVGSTALEVPVVGRAMTREEYIQQAVAAYNASVQQANYGAMYVQDGNRGLALAGFPSLSADDVNGFLGMFDQLASPEDGEIPPEIVQALEILSTIGEQQIEEWLWALVLAERAGQFEQEYSRLSQEEGFDRLTQAMQIILSASQGDVKAVIYQFTRDLAATGTDDLAEALTIIVEQPPFGIGDPVAAKAFWIYLQQAFNLGFPLGIAHWLAGVWAFDFWTQFELALKEYPPEERPQYRRDVADILQHLIDTVTDPQQRANLADGIKSVISDIAKGNAVKENKALLHVAAVSVRGTEDGGYGWFLKGVRKRVGGKSIDLVLFKPGYYLAGSETWVDALSLVNFYECGGNCERIKDRILGELAAIMDNLGQLLKEYGANFAIIGLVIVDPSVGLASIIQAIYDQYNGTEAAIFVIWTDPGGQSWFVCIGQGCGKMSSQQRRDEACRHAGLPAGCSFREWVYQKPSEGELPPPPDDEEPIEWNP